MLSDEQVEEIERRAEAWAAALALPDEAALEAAVEEQLARLTDPPIGKRRATVLAVAQVGLTEASRRNIFQQPGVVSRRIFYAGDKDWYHGEVFRDVLERLIRLYRRWSAGQSAREATEEFRERITALRSAEAEIGSKMFDLARQMAASPLYDVVATGEDGRDVTLKPARWTMADLPRVAKGASELLRLSLDMAPGGRQEVAVNWTEHLPDGVTAAQADAALESWARMMAAGQIAAEDEDDDE